MGFSIFSIILSVFLFLESANKLNQITLETHLNHNNNEEKICLNYNQKCSKMLIFYSFLICVALIQCKF